MVCSILSKTYALSRLCMSVVSLTITQDTVQNLSFTGPIQNLTIGPNVRYSVSNNEITKVKGPVRNEGVFHLSGSNDQEVSISVSGPSFENMNSFVFDSRDPSTKGSYSIRSDTFRNSGEMYVGVSGNLYSVSMLDITAKKSWRNSGSMTFETTQGFTKSLKLACEGGPVINDGAICLVNIDWTPSSDLSGDGCIIVEKGAKVRIIANGDNHGDPGVFVSPYQTIFLADSSSVLEIVLSGTSCLNEYPTYKVAGFGNSNAIRFTFFFHLYSYSPETGILTVRARDSGINLDIGKGYLLYHFNRSQGLMGSHISYSFDPPNAAPLICTCSKPSLEGLS
ncbi:hypothetical protein OXX59_005148 [Metschnikowia pulcherrima]